jgi:hypothetical protein
VSEHALWRRQRGKPVQPRRTPRPIVGANNLLVLKSAPTRKTALAPIGARAVLRTYTFNNKDWLLGQDSNLQAFGSPLAIRRSRLESAVLGCLQELL